MINLKDSARFDAARQIFDDILNKRPPNDKLLVFLHGEKIAKIISKAILRFYSNPKFVTGTIRKHDVTAPTTLSHMRKLIDNDEDFSAIDEYFSSQIDRSENINVIIDEITTQVGVNFKNKFGPYANHAINAAALAVTNQLRRKSDISTLCHWNGAAGIMHFLQATNNISEYSNPYLRTIVTFLHDFEEDLPRLIMHKDGRAYGLSRSVEFGNDYLPNDPIVIRDVNILTNLYNEIAKSAYYVLKNEGKIFTVNNFITYLKNLMVKEEFTNNSMYLLYVDLYTLISEKSYGDLAGKDLLSTIAWDSYKFYINKIIVESVKYDDDTPIITKFCDQTYNFIGKEALSDPDMMKTLLKVTLWASKVYDHESNFKYAKDFARELLEDALCYSEYYVIRDFMRREAVVPFYFSAFQKIQRLSPIFYTDM
ncbi:MAG: hypothetical protein ACP5N1_04295 [Candidatus Woesearchaeota archaeon]